MNVATQLQAVVVSWQIYALTHDPLSLGLIGLAEALPFIGFALPAGHLADRDPRLRIARWSLAALLGCSLALLWFTVQPGTAASGARLADLSRHLPQRHRPELSPAIPHGAQRGARAAAAVSQRRDVAQLDLAARRRPRARRSAG